MGTKTSGYKSKKYDFPTKRYCQTLDLKNDSGLIEEYIKRHNPENHWPVIREGIRDVGILEMEIYLFGNRLFMIVETSLEFNWDIAFSELASLPRQAEWEEYMSVFQDAETGASSNEKWQLMDQIFKLYE